MSELDHVTQFRDEWGALNSKYIVDLLTALEEKDAKAVSAKRCVKLFKIKVSELRTSIFTISALKSRLE